MALDNVLASIPGLGGYLAMEQYKQRQALGGLQGALGVLNAVRGYDEAQAQAQMRPLQMQMLQAQAGEAQAKTRDRQAVESAISALPQQQQALARLAPQQFVSGLTKNPMEGAPEIVKLQTWQKRLSDAGDTAGSEQIGRLIENKEIGGTSQHERAYRTLLGFQRDVNAGKTLTPEQELEAQAVRSILSRQEMAIDPVTKEPYWKQPITIPDAISVGRIPGGSVGAPTVGGGRPVNALPPLTSGRAPLDRGDRDQLEMNASARNMAADLQKAFKPEFGGFASDIVGSAVNEFGRRFGADGEKTQQMAQFWETYEQWITDMRKEKFGATLTGNELAQFDRLRAKPSQTPTQIQNNLTRQVQLVEQAMGRRMTALARQGVNQQAIEGAVGWGQQRPSNLVAPTQPMQRTVKRTGRLPDGRKVVEYSDGTIEEAR